MLFRINKLLLAVRKVTSRALAGVLVLAALSVTASAAPDQNTLKLSFSTFDVFATYTKRSCAAQADLRSARGQKMAFVIYWLPGKALYLMTQHPGYASARGKQVVQFRFPNGETMAFAMKRKGARVQANIGFGASAKKFYKLIEANQSVRMELPGIGDTVDVNLSRRREIEGAMRHCRDWLKS